MLVLIITKVKGGGGHIPFLATPLCIILIGAAPKKVSLFDNISQTKNSVWANIGQFLTV
jgi:hypothetical protein